MNWLLLLFGYLIGSLLPAELIVRRRTGQTPHELDDNPGGGGAWRHAGPVAGLSVLLFDFTKGALPVAIATQQGLHGLWLAAVAASPVAGHSWPIQKVIHFQRGGRGLAAATGALFWLAFPQMLPAYAVAALVALKTRWLPTIGLVAFPLGIILMLLTIGPTERFWVAVAVMGVMTLRNILLVVAALRALLHQQVRLPH